MSVEEELKRDLVQKVFVLGSTLSKTPFEAEQVRSWGVVGLRRFRVCQDKSLFSSLPRSPTSMVEEPGLGLKGE